MTADLLIIGGGAAGIAAAITAAETSARVIIAEASPRLGAKILRAGGGRCNLSNAALDLCDRQNRQKIAYEKFYGAAKNFVKPALSAIDSRALAEFFAHCGVELFASAEFAAGDAALLKIFPRSEKSRDVLDSLERRLAALSVRVVTECQLTGCELSAHTWRARDARGQKFFAQKLLISGGGDAAVADPSPRSALVAALEKLGHSFTPSLPALAPMVCTNFLELAGVSVPDIELSRANAPAKKYRGDLLFTHSGLSGPAILDFSGEIAAEILARGSCEIAINFLPELTWEKFSAQCGGGQKLSFPLPKRVSEKLLALAGVAPYRRAAELTARQREQIFTAITNQRLLLTETAAISQSMATRGGVRREEIKAKTLASKIQPELYFAGEIIDVDGISGGFNLHWAFASGIFAARQMFANNRVF